MSESTRTPILIGLSGAAVVRVRQADGVEWIEKTGRADEIAREAAVIRWCNGRLPVAALLDERDGCVAMSALPGLDLTHLSTEQATHTIVEALHIIHAVPIDGCPFDARWSVRLRDAARRVEAGLVDESDFDDDVIGRTAEDVLAELRRLPAPRGIACFTHGDACLPNFLADSGRLTGIVDLGRAGVSHPAQDWALALRSMRDNRGPDAEQSLRRFVPPDCADDSLLRQFRLLDELF